MREAKAADLAWGVAEELVATFTPAHRVALLELNEALQLHSDLTNDPGALRQALSKARTRPPHGLSAVYNATVLLSQKLQGAGFADVLYLVSDCEDTMGVETDVSAIEAATRSGVRVFVTRVTGSPASAHQAAAHARSWAARITYVTGGRVVDLDRFKDKQFTASLAHAVREVYHLEVHLPRPVDKPRELEIEVLGPDGTRIQNDRLLYPRVLAPSPNPAPPAGRP